MSLMDLKCQESIYITERGCYNAKDKKSLLVGEDYCNQYLIYLFFSLPSYSYIRNLKEARLILFKLPQVGDDDANLNQECGNYSVAPLVDFFSIYGCNYSPACIDYSQIITFREECCCSYMEVNITRIIKTWIEEKIENKGLLLYGNKEAPLVIYASNRYRIEGMRPKLRLVYEDDCFGKNLSSVPCTVTVK